MSGCDCPPGLCTFCAFMASLRGNLKGTPPVNQDKPGLHEDSQVMISAGEIEPGVTLLINGNGRYVLRLADPAAGVDGNALTAALERTRQVADLVARSASPVSAMSGPAGRSLAHFGCSVERQP